MCNRGSQVPMRPLQVGRSGRFGHLGLAVNLITYDDRFNLCASLIGPPFFSQRGSKDVAA